MRRKNSLPELLAPAGDFESLIAAVSAGADAVYVGGKLFSARAYAKNFDIEEIASAVSYCHLHGVKLYVTVNTLVYDRELSELSDYVCALWEAGVDAVITADLGVIREMRRRVPEMEIHASTQMSLHNTAGVNAAAELLGCVRAVVARELSIENIRKITEEAKVEIEVFLHGALCVCHSGQCLMSSLVGGRSGNRGECAQPCRLPYNGGAYPLSLKDLSLAEHIRELIDSGVASLKIEGRMKSPEYVYTVTSIYRHLIDEGRMPTKEELTALRSVFSRGGFTDGYFRGKSLDGMTGVRSEKDKEITRELSSVSFSREKVRISAKASILLGKPAELTLNLGEKSVCVTGAVAEKAQNAPLTPDDVKMRLSKMGNTDFILDVSDITLNLEEGVNLAPSAINALRRDAVAKLSSCRRPSVKSEPFTMTRTKKAEKPLKTALFYDPEVLLGIGSEVAEFFDIIFLPLHRFGEIDIEVNGVAIPPIIFDTELSGVERMLKNATECGVRYALVSNLGAVQLAASHGLVPIGDFRLNMANSLSRRQYEQMGIERFILSPELTLPMARDIGGGAIVYGRIPLMLTERCFMKENFGCEKCSRCFLTDRTGARFPMIREYPHRNLLLNSAVTYMGDKRRELDRAGLHHAHFIFTIERQSEVLAVMDSYKRSLPLKCAVRRMGVKK